MLYFTCGELELGLSERARAQDDDSPAPIQKLIVHVKRKNFKNIKTEEGKKSYVNQYVSNSHSPSILK